MEGSQPGEQLVLPGMRNQALGRDNTDNKERKHSIYLYNIYYYTIRTKLESRTTSRTRPCEHSQQARIVVVSLTH